MFNSGLRKEAEATLKSAVDDHTKETKKLQKEIEQLHAERTELQETLTKAFYFINSRKNTPEKFNVQVKEIKWDLNYYNNLIYEVKSDYKAPTVAIVTTFGAASAGTAISALTGAAATNAALAWLGGGTLVAGGAGVAGGEALLALAGPIGWAIGGAAVVGGGLFASGKNKEAAEKMYSQAAEVHASEKSSI